MQPVVKPLPRWQRTLIFVVLLLAFLLSLPVFVFYATGYRYDFFGDSPTITVTGGLYISVEADEGVIYIDEEEVDNARIFRKAAYIQGLEPGLHRVHVQADGLHTWVKNLAVYPQIVTEAEVFNLPIQPQVRPITRLITENDEPVMHITSGTTTPLLPYTKASTSIPILVPNNVTTSTYEINSEFVLLEELFAEKSSTTLALREQEEKREKEKKRFAFATTTPSVKTEDEILATTTVIRDDMKLYQDGDDVFAVALGTGRDVPDYFCSKQTSTTSNSSLNEVTEISEEEVIKNILTAFTDPTSSIHGCRKNIRIDRKWQEVQDFDFYPNDTNLVLMHLEDGVYVVEIDDRSWQNAQLLYPGTDLIMLIHSGAIFIKDGDLIVEALTELIES